MKHSKINLTIIKVFIYISGIFITSLGINILLRSRLGAGAWDTVTSNLSALTDLSLGISSAIINITILIFILIYHQSFKHFIVLIPIFGIALSIYFWDLLIFKDFETNLLWLRLLMFGVGASVLTLGLAMMISTKYPAMVFDELTLTLMKLFHVKTFLAMRLGIELFAIFLGSIFGWIAGIGFGAVNLGSFILAVSIGMLITLHLKWINKLMEWNGKHDGNQNQ